MKSALPFSVLVRAYLFAALGGAASLLTSNAAAGELGTSPAFVLVWLSLYASTFVAWFISYRGSVRRSEVLPYAVCALVLLSAAWSQLPGQTLRYGVSLASNVLFACICARKLAFDEFFKHLRWTINWMTAAGLLLAAAGVSVAFYIDPIDRSNILGTALIKGLYSHKIYAGLYCAIGFYLNVLSDRKWERYFFAPLCLFGVLVSGSSLGLVALAVGCFAWWGLVLLARKKLRTPLAILIFVGSSAAAAVIAAQLSLILDLLGRDLTLTGRTELWAAAIDFWKVKPSFGWGYAGIFGDDPSAPSAAINQYSHYQAPHFHSGYLQLLAELGVVGSSLVMVMIFLAISRPITFYWRSQNRQALAAAIICVMLITSATGMHLLLRYNELSVLLIFFCALAFSEKRLRERGTGQ